MIQVVTLRSLDPNIQNQWLQTGPNWLSWLPIDLWGALFDTIHLTAMTAMDGYGRTSLLSDFAGESFDAWQDCDGMCEDAQSGWDLKEGKSILNNQLLKFMIKIMMDIIGYK